MSEIPDELLDWPMRHIEQPGMAGGGMRVCCAAKVIVRHTDPRVSKVPVAEEVECAMLLDESADTPRDFLLHLGSHIRQVHNGGK